MFGFPVSRLSVGRFSDVRLPAALFPGRLMPEFLLSGAYAENVLPESCSMLPGWLLSGCFPPCYPVACYPVAYFRDCRLPGLLPFGFVSLGLYA